MPTRDQHQPARRLLVVMPTWFGDILMATPTLRALRTLWPDAHLAVLVRENLTDLVEGLSAIDQILPAPAKGQGGSAFRLAKRLSRMDFDTAVLLPNSFRSAALVAMAGIPRRVGYDRDGRGVLLTDRLIPRRESRVFLPVPTLDYYLSLARYLGAPSQDGDHAMHVATRPEDDARAAELLAPAKGRPVVLFNPGAQKPAKRWPAERFAQLAARCTEERGCAVAVTGSPAERDVLARVTGAATTAVIDLPKAGMNVRLLKSVARHAAVMVTNDTGPRHLAAAVGTPLVTLFGPTTPEWTHIGFDHERQVVARDAGQPDSIKQITVDEVFRRVEELLALGPDAPASAPAEPDASAPGSGSAPRSAPDPAARAQP
ncbi:MAG: lipopolysaccharide heptosyltransferase II [Planctomycetota bacterium]